MGLWLHSSTGAVQMTPTDALIPGRQEARPPIGPGSPITNGQTCALRPASVRPEYGPLVPGLIAEPHEQLAGTSSWNELYCEAFPLLCQNDIRGLWVLHVFFLSPWGFYSAASTLYDKSTVFFGKQEQL